MEIPRHHRTRQQKLNMMGEICPDCEKPIFPPRDKCPYPDCSGEAKININDVPKAIYERTLRLAEISQQS